MRGQAVLAAACAGLIVAAAALALGELSVAAQQERAIAETVAGAEAGAARAATAVSDRVIRPQAALAAAAQGLLVQYGAARRDKAILEGILADLRPLIGPPDEIRYVFAIDRSGEVVAADPPGAVAGQGPVSGPWSLLVREGRTAVSDVWGGPDGSASVLVAVPVRDGFGQPAGGLAAVIDLTDAPSWLAPTLGPGTAAALYAGGTVLAGPAPGAHLVAEREVPGLDWKVGVIGSREAGASLGTVTAALRAAAAALGILTFAAVLALLLLRDRLRLATAQAVAHDESVSAAGRHRAIYLDRLGQALRAPLNSIAGFSGLLAEKLAGSPGGGPEARWLENIRAETAQLVALTSDATGLSALDSGDLVLQPRAIALAELMAPLARSADRAAAPRDVKVVHAAGDGDVVLDVERVRRISAALIDRAIRHAPPGSRVTVTASAADHAFSLLVESAGVGLPSERLSAVRESLAGLPDRSELPGTALSLALAARVAGLHGGSISYSEADDHTGSFHFRIPRAA